MPDGARQKKTKPAKAAAAGYNRVLRLVRDKVGRDVTYGATLDEMGRRLLGSSFAGVFAADEVPALSLSAPYAIANLDRSNEPGSHWVGLCRLGTGHTLVYDSFGRRPRSILPEAPGRLTGTDPDAEQRTDEEDCGARSLAWILFCAHAGPEAAALI